MRSVGKARQSPGVPGRPRKAPDKLRSNRMRIRFSSRRLAFITQNAEGKTVPELMRELLLARLRRQRRNRIPLENRKAMGQVSKVGNNVKQLVGLTGAGRLPAHSEPLLRRLYEGLVEYRQALTGDPQ